LKKSSFIYFLSRYLNTYLPLHTGASVNTIKAYSDTFKLLFLFAKEKYKLKPQRIELEMIDRKFILAFLVWITKKRKCSDTTRNLRLRNIKGFFLLYTDRDAKHRIASSKHLADSKKENTSTGD